MTKSFVHLTPSRRAPRGAKLLHAVALCTLALLVQPGRAADLTWTGGDGAWEDVSNWSSMALPTNLDFVEIGSAVSVSSTAATNIAEEFLSHAALSISSGLLTIVGTFDSFGVVSVGANAALDAGRIFVQAAGGLDVSGTGGIVSVIEGVFSSGYVTLDEHALLRAESFDNFNQWHIAGAARAEANSMINHSLALLRVQEAGSKLDIDGNLTNLGRFEVDGAEVLIDSIDNLGVSFFSAGATVSGESVNSTGDVEATGIGTSWTLDFLTVGSGRAAVTGQAVATLGTLLNAADVMVDAAQLGGGNIDNLSTGNLQLSNAASVNMTNAILNRGTIAVDAGSNLGAATFLQLGGTTRLDGGTLAATSVFGAAIASGLLSGHGTIDTNLRVLADGVLAPGDDLADRTARFDISGDVFLNGEYIVEIGGTGLSQFDHIIAGGDATLAGLLSVLLVDGFQPVVGDYFDIVIASQVDGTFAAMDLPILTAAWKFDTIRTDQYFRLFVSAVPLPPAFPLFGLAAALLMVHARRRKLTY